MKSNEKINDPNRRDFIFKALSSCALCCFAAPRIIAGDVTSESYLSDSEHKFDKDSGMSNQAVYDFAFKFTYIPAMRELQDKFGKERFIELLKEASLKMHENGDSDIDFSERTLEVWASNMKGGIEAWSNQLTCEIVKEDANIFEIKFSECLWAKTFREENASEIGYAGICYQDYGTTKAFNPKIELIRDKTLMEGNDCCHFKWIKKD